jgi:gliding motility-associated-like protein
MKASLPNYRRDQMNNPSIFILTFACILLLNVQALQAQTPIVIPNVFTPNNDNNNDEFSINLSGITVTDYNLKIYNKWGALMFTSQNSNINWDGRTAAGIKVPAGNYYYVVVINGITYSDALLLIY